MNASDQKSLEDQISEMNHGKPDYKTYTKRVRELFGLDPITVDKKKCYFLAGFIEGEGSISISVKRNLNSKFGIELDPNFNITQHVNGVKHLYLALEVFKTGRIRFKHGSNATLVFVIEPRKSLQEKVCPFFEEYLVKGDLSSKFKKERYQNFKKMLDLFDDSAHLDKDRLINELLPIWDSMQIQKQKNSSFESLEEAQEFVRTFQK